MIKKISIPVVVVALTLLGYFLVKNLTQENSVQDFVAETSTTTIQGTNTQTATSSVMTTKSSASSNVINSHPQDTPTTTQSLYTGVVTGSSYSHAVGGTEFVVKLNQNEVFSLVYYLPSENPESLQMFAVDKNVVSLMDEKNFKPYFDLYIDKPIRNDGMKSCYLEFCYLPIKKTFETNSRSWNDLGSSSYGDAGYHSTYPHVYSTVVGDFTVYAKSESDLTKMDNINLQKLFYSLDFEVK